MKPDFSHEAPDQDSAFDPLFKIQPMASPDFAERTLAAIRARNRRLQRRRFAVWTSALAASLAVIIGLNFAQPGGGDNGPMATVDSPEPVRMAAASERPARFVHDGPTPGELTSLLYAALLESDDEMFGNGGEIEALLAEAIATSDVESLNTLDILVLLAGY